ncbi:MAG: CDP-diacylglycerol--serine O-phosphatidyltransferase [Bacteroidetes bacterium]|nr:CDP-diacylglycerol--serine O-phosphatidyltransferase [Bacteroidota bacterium]
MRIKNNIPNLITLLNLFCGCLAIVAAFKTDLIIASYLIFAGAIFDYLDGTAARLLKAKSEIGKELDSLADVVSFGIVPSIIAFQLLNKYSIDIPIFQNFKFLLYFPFLIALLSAVRLAKFNIDDRQTISFLGLPTPANAIFWASAPLIIYFQYYTNFEYLKCIHIFLSNLFQNPYFIFLLSIIMSILLIVELPLFSLKFKDFTWKNNKIKIVFILISSLLLLLLNAAALPIIIILYIILSVIHQYLL